MPLALMHGLGVAHAFTLLVATTSSATAPKSHVTTLDSHSGTALHNFERPINLLLRPPDANAAITTSSAAATGCNTGPCVVQRKQCIPFPGNICRAPDSDIVIPAAL
jgi:hypothetical protein